MLVGYTLHTTACGVNFFLAWDKLERVLVAWAGSALEVVTNVPAERSILPHHKVTRDGGAARSARCFGGERLLDHAVQTLATRSERTPRAHTIAGLKRFGLLTLEQVLGDHGSTAITSVNSTMVATRTNARASRKIAAVVSLSRFTVGLLRLEFERLVREVADGATND